MRIGWQTTTLGNICSIQLGATPARKIAKYYDPDKVTDNMWLSIADMPKTIGQELIESKEYLSDEGAEKVKLVPKGTLLFSFKLSIGRICFAGKDLRTNEAIAALSINNEEYVGKRYLAWFLASQNWEIIAANDEKVKGKTLNKAKLKELTVIVSPRWEQRRIVEILDEAFEAIDVAVTNAKHNLANVLELYESHLNNVFSQKGDGWVDKTLKDVSIDFGRGKSKHRPRNDPKLYSGPYPFIQTGDVRNSGHLIRNSTQSYNEVGLAQSKLWPKGTICITIAANIAETGVLDFDACFPDSIIGIVVDDAQTSNGYVEYLLQSVKARIKAKGKGSAQDNINLATFENELFPFPSLEKQHDIFEKLNEFSSKTNQLEDIYLRKLSALAELRLSILQKAFSGELTAGDVEPKEEVVA